MDDEIAPQRAHLDRRAFLAGGVGTTVALGFASLLPAGCTAYPQPPATVAVLDAKQYAVLRAAAPHYLGRDPVLDGIDVARVVDEIVAGLAPPVRAQIGQALGLVEHGTLLFAPSFQRFTRMDAAARQRYVDGWAASRLAFRRTVHAALRNLCLVAYYTQQPAWGALRYQGPWVGRLQVARVPPRFPLPEGSVKT